jgi:hypothetical protein
MMANEAERQVLAAPVRSAGLQRHVLAPGRAAAVQDGGAPAVVELERRERTRRPFPPPG